MPNPNFNSTTTTNFETSIGNYSVDQKSTDGNYGQKENKWINSTATQYYGYYHGIGEFRSALDSYATWVIGQGITYESIEDEVIFFNITGWGEDTIYSILWNMVVVKKAIGDSYSEIILDEEGELLNLKPLNPSKMAHITNTKGIIKFYEYTMGDGTQKRYNPKQILHFCNNRILDEPHGTAVTSAVKWVLTTIEEARRDWRRIMHRSAVRILYVDEEDTTRQAKLKIELAAGIKNGDVLILTCKPGEAKFEDLVVPPADAWVIYLNYLEDKLYKQLGVPKVVLGGTSENTEASAKVGVISYEPIWSREIMEIEADILNQLNFRIKINKQPSLMDNMQRDEAKNTGQVGFQPNDTAYGSGK